MRKNYLRYLFCCLLLLWGSGTALAGGGQGQAKVKPIICAISNYYECYPGDDCRQKTAAELHAPQFFKILLNEKKIVLLGQHRSDKQASKIKSLALVNGVIIIQGAESSTAKGEGGIGWSLSINEKTGGMVFSASGDEVGYIGTGMCTVY